jgi:hypothetical protein
MAPIGRYYRPPFHLSPRHGTVVAPENLLSVIEAFLKVKMPLISLSLNTR